MGRSSSPPTGYWRSTRRSATEGLDRRYGTELLQRSGHITATDVCRNPERPATATPAPARWWWTS